MSEFIPIAKVDISDIELGKVADVLRSGWLTTGPRVREFETRCCEYLGCRHALAVNSGTAALHLALSALGIGPGDEVITSPLTFAATANAALYVGATPVLADVDLTTLNLCPKSVTERITSRTKVVLVVHYGGAPVDVSAFERLAREHRIQIVEDAAHAIGAAYQGRKIGTDSLAACFSFHPVKNITTAEGGLLVTNDDQLDRIARLRSWHGIDKSALNRYEKGGSWYYEVQDLGYKYNMTDIQAAIGLAQLARLDTINARRRAIAAEYDMALAGLDGVRVAPCRHEITDARHLYWIVLDTDRYDRQTFIAALGARGVGSGVHYIPLNLHPYYQRRLGWGPGMCPAAERAYRGLVTLPLFQQMTAEQSGRVTAAVRAALAEALR